MNQRILILEPDRYPPAALELLGGIGSVSRLGVDAGASLPEALKTADVLVIRLGYLLDRQFLAHAPNLRVIATATTGLDHIDIDCAKERGITVLSLRGETDLLRTVTATAEHAWGLLLALIRHIPAAHESVVRGEWNRDLFFGRELQGRTLGLVGLGRIGRMMARYGLAFGMCVRAFDPVQSEWVEGVEKSESLQDLISSADVISLHVHLTPKTSGMIGRRELGWARRGAVLLNTSRGGLLDQEALLDALEDGRLTGAALDVVADEYEVNSTRRERLLRYASAHSNLLLTPHLGGATHDSLEKVEIFMAEKLVKHLEGRSA